MFATFKSSGQRGVAQLNEVFAMAIMTPEYKVSTPGYVLFETLEEGALFEFAGLRLIKNIEMNEGGNATLFDNSRQSIRIPTDAVVKPC